MAVDLAKQLLPGAFEHALHPLLGARRRCVDDARHLAGRIPVMDRPLTNPQLRGDGTLAKALEKEVL